MNIRMSRKRAKPEPATPRAPFKPGTMLSLRTPLDAQISPDGRYVAFLVNEYVPDRPKARPRLWLAPVDGGEAHPVALATGDDRGEDSCPRWSPDSKRIAFLSTRGASSRRHEANLCHDTRRRRTRRGAQGVQSAEWRREPGVVAGWQAYRLRRAGRRRSQRAIPLSLARSQPVATAASGPCARRATHRSRSRRQT